MTRWFASLWLVALLLAALLAAWLPLADPFAMDLSKTAAAPGTSHWLGTDALGRDILSRLVHGARLSLAIGVLAPALGLLAGGLLGLTAAYQDGLAGRVVGIGFDTLLAFPGIVLVILLTSWLGQSVLGISVALGVISLPTFGRVTRAHARAILQREYIAAARAGGATDARIAWRHVVPNLMPVMRDYALVMAAIAVVLEGGLSFLGLGISAPQPSWGSMIAEGRDYLDESPWLCLFPAGAIFCTVFSLNVLGGNATAGIKSN